MTSGRWRAALLHARPGPSARRHGRPYEAGFSTFDLADHYGPAEDFVGDFLQLRWENAKAQYEERLVSELGGAQRQRRRRRRRRRRRAPPPPMPPKTTSC